MYFSSLLYLLIICSNIVHTITTKHGTMVNKSNTDQIINLRLSLKKLSIQNKKLIALLKYAKTKGDNVVSTFEEKVVERIKENLKFEDLIKKKIEEYYMRHTSSSAHLSNVSNGKLVVRLQNTLKKLKKQRKRMISLLKHHMEEEHYKLSDTDKKLIDRIKENLKSQALIKKKIEVYYMEVPANRKQLNISVDTKQLNISVDTKQLNITVNTKQSNRVKPLEKPMRSSINTHSQTPRLITLVCVVIAVVICLVSILALYHKFKPHVKQTQTIQNDEMYTVDHIHD